MRQLTSKQKKLLDKWFMEYRPMDVDSLELEHWEILESINDTEILWQNVNRYLGDKLTEQTFSREF